MILSIVTGFSATLGFGFIFNIRGIKLIYAAIGGALSCFLLELLPQFNIPWIMTLFISSMSFTAYSEIFARKLKTPVTTFIICALIPLVPGGKMYYTMLEIIQGNNTLAFQYGLDTLTDAGVLALGIVFISTLTKLMITKKKS